MDGEIFIAALTAASDICSAIKTPREIEVKMAEDDGNEDLLWAAWELMEEVNPPLGCDWNKKFAAWEQEYFGQDDDCDE